MFRRYNFYKMRSLVILALAAMVLAGSTSASAQQFFQGFETDIAGWETPTRVPSGTNGTPSRTGAYHATTAAGAGDFTRWGGYNYGAGNAVPTAFREYKTSLDIYLNVEGGWANNTRFDFSSAINNAGGTHLSDFIFNGGFYNDAGGPGSGTDRFVISTSPNSQPGSAFAKNPARDPIAISTTGWYTFEHHFYNDAGVLNVDMSIYDAGGVLVKKWTLVSAPIAGVGGNRYGWFDYNQFSTLAFDNTLLALLPDTDGDGVPDEIDNCDINANPGQEDIDFDGIGDVCDNCPTVSNADQADADGDNLGNACDACPLDAANDADDDGVCDNVDACPGTPPGTVVNASGCPLAVNKDQCKNNGWQTLRRANNTTFKNQGDCIQYANTGK